MHLSLLSDGFLSDSLNDHGGPAHLDISGAGRLHRDGVVRGILFAISLAIPVLLILGFSPARETIDGWADHTISSPAILRTVSIRLSR